MPDEILPAAGRYPFGTKSSRWEDGKKTPHSQVDYGVFFTDGVGFEPTEGINLRRFSRPLH